MLGDVVGEEHLGLLRGDAEFGVRGHAAFRGHERRVGEDEVGPLVPARVVAQGVVDVDGGVGKAVEEEVHLAQFHHLVVHVVAGEVAIDLLALGVGELVAGQGRAGRGAVREDVPVGGDEEAARAAGGVEDFVAGLRVEAGDDEINDVARGAELAVLTLRAGALQEVFKGVAQFLAVRVGEAVHLGEEHGEDASVAEFQEGVAEDVAEQAGQVRGGDDSFSFAILLNLDLRAAKNLDAARKERDAFVGGDGLREEISPAVFRQFAGEEAAFAAELHGFLVEVVHEFVNERERDEFDLIGRLGEFTDEDIAAGVNTAFSFGVEHVECCENSPLVWPKEGSR